MTQGMEESISLNVGFTSQKKFIEKKKKKKVTSEGFVPKPPSLKVQRHTFKPIKDNEDDDSDYNDEVHFVKPRSDHSVGRMSSLFGNNPDIPAAADRNVDPVEEDVFSSALYKDNKEIHPYTVQNLEQSFGITQLTTVQRMSLPVLLSGKDALIRSQTGSGKTLAYAVPIVESLQKVRPKLTRADGIKAVVVLPTRELALQTYECFVKLVKSFAWLVPGILVGGEKRKSEKARLRKGINILVGTPGRLIDHAQHTEVVSLNSVQWLVLDEADRLLDMGYEKDVASLVSIIEEQRAKSGSSSTRHQTVLLSATLTSQVEKLAGLALNSPTRIDASSSNEEELVIPKSLKQFYVVTPPKLRLVTLASFIYWKCQVEGHGKMLIFMATQDMVDYHMELFTSVLKDTAEFLTLHGSMLQHERTSVFKAFRDATSGVLLCTDVAARGLNLPSVNWIIQYTAPATPTDYVHRVGRTARVGHKGSSLLFLSPSESQFVTQLQDKRIKMKEENMMSCLENLQMMDLEDGDSQGKGRGKGGGIEASATALQLAFENAVLEQKGLKTGACKAYISWVRFYATYPRESRTAFNFQDLHLGHYAKSFALRDPPSSIGKTKHNHGNNKRFEKSFPEKRRYTSSKPRATVGEHESGLQPNKKKKKTVYIKTLYRPISNTDVLGEVDRLSVPGNDVVGVATHMKPILY